MRERSHKIGEIYQKDVKHWLASRTFMGLEAVAFGDAYDVTKKACAIGDLVFDFSLRLGRGDVGRHVLYAECKYRDERKGNVNTEFREFLKRVAEALTTGETEEAETALFVFVSNVPPDHWRRFLVDRRAFCETTCGAEAVDRRILDRMAHLVFVLVLSAEIVAKS